MLRFSLLGRVTLRKQTGKRCGHNGPNCIYKLTSPVGKSYVGQTQCITCRFGRYKWGQSHRGTAPIACAVKKYGWGNMKKEVLVEGISEDLLDDEEVRLIAVHDTLCPKGYNVLKGGQRNSGYKRRDGPLVKGPRSEATKGKISQGHAEWRDAKIAQIEDREEAMRVDAFLAKERVLRKQRRAARESMSAEELNAQAKQRRDETWRQKREAKWEAMGLSKEEKDVERQKAEARKRVRATYECKHPGERAALNKEYMKVNWRKYDARGSGLTGNLRANCEAGKATSQ